MCPGPANQMVRGQACAALPAECVTHRLSRISFLARQATLLSGTDLACQTQGVPLDPSLYDPPIAHGHDVHTRK
jgi:hypothetical protein